MSTRRPVRLISVVGATVIALACGTNYAYSAWAPEFGDRLKLSSTQTNLVGTFGNFGMYTAGIPIGLLVDKHGPRPGVTLGAVLLGFGYFSIYRSFNAGPEDVSMPWLCFSSYMTGLGGCAAFAGAVKTSALNWPNARGTATACPLAAFGLSALFFATMSHLAFPEDTSDLLLLLTIATFSMVIVGGIFLRVVPLSPDVHSVDRSNPASTLLKRAKSDDNRPRRYEPGTQQEPSSPLEHPSTDTGPSMEPEDLRQGDTETSSLISKSTGLEDVLETAKDDEDDHSRNIDVRGFALLSHLKFYMLWVMMGLMTGVGLMTINNIGNDARAIWRHYDDSVSPEFIQQRQLMHVEILSFMSFCGRLASGVGSDVIVKKFKMSRFWCLLFSSLIFCLAQIFGFTTTTPHALGLVSGLNGLAYGFLFGVYPTLVVETFGIAGFSQNWGTMTLAPILFGNAFNSVYGWVYDGHSVIRGDGARDCRDGLECYRNAYIVTTVACILGVGVSVWSIRHDYVGKREGKSAKERDYSREA